MSTYFGKPECGQIEISSEFSPICRDWSIEGTTPLGLTVPAGTAAVPVPPPECACVAFKSSTVYATHKNEEDSISISIAPAKGADCCAGYYDISTALNIKPQNLSVCVPGIEGKAGTLTVTYSTTDDSGLTQDNTVTAELTMSAVRANNGSCAPWQLSVSGTLDLGSIVSDASGGFDSYGDIVKAGGSLWIQHDPASEDPVLAGGVSGASAHAGCVNRAETVRRCPAMWGYDSVAGQTVSPPGVTGGYAVTLGGGVGGLHAYSSWHSVTVGEGANGDAVEVKPQGADFCTGPLSVIAPTGVQWHDRGIALVLSEFFYSESGVLSEFNETGDFAVVAPPPSCRYTNGDYATPLGGISMQLYDENANVPRKGDNTADGQTCRYLSGIEVACGPGLRVIRDADVPDVCNTLAAYRMGALELNTAKSDFMFYSDGASCSLALNDQYATGASVMTLGTNSGVDTEWMRNKAGGGRKQELIIPIVVDVDTITTTIDGITVVQGMTTRKAWLRIAANGLVLAAYSKDVKITRGAYSSWGSRTAAQFNTYVTGARASALASGAQSGTGAFTA